MEIENKTIGIACDHAAYKTKEALKEKLMNQGYAVMDFGTHSEESCDYPDFAHLLGEAISKKKCDFGFSLCGSGNGITMTANKHKGVRAALCWMPEIATLAKQHNDANICGIPARFVTIEQAFAIADAFIKAEFEGGRHQKRVEKIEAV
ncbi:MAG: ribose 5-phosphate isomerase B [Bacteroidetes bacterium GWF2_38_335]|nr:MAG: ribose 5-phosphate isomerase B [Bacteroidetes bacterium GWF2_38_335]OFY78556.1 MAG: ribose 5-phosphate isomerase B [Bacteroidetes bacterium RIFOXYA12_FULL_38_20]HBS85052.1 ribose 5-phosphate isomerase B [Bacteroidales bacterium]